MFEQYKIRRMTALEWTMDNPILGRSTPGYETDTKKVKYGDGVNRWVDLAYTPTSAIEVDHGSLADLGGDDHQQYLTNDRHITAHDIINVEYEELLALATSSGLLEGYKYRITDFQTIHAIYGSDTVEPYIAEINEGPVEPLIVTAISSDEISPIAVSETFPDDIIQYELVTSDVWPPTDFPKGRILYRKDTRYQIEIYEDWRSTKYRRWTNGCISTVSFSGTGDNDVTVVSRPLNRADDFSLFILIDGAETFSWGYQVSGVNPRDTLVATGLPITGGAVHELTDDLHILFSNPTPSHVLDDSWSFNIKPNYILCTYPTIEQVLDYVDVYTIHNRSATELAFNIRIEPQYNNGLHNIVIGANIPADVVYDGYGYNVNTIDIGMYCDRFTIGHGTDCVWVRGTYGDLILGNGCSHLTIGMCGDGTVLGDGCSNVNIGENSGGHNIGANCSSILIESGYRSVTLSAGQSNITYRNGDDAPKDVTFQELYDLAGHGVQPVAIVGWYNNGLAISPVIEKGHKFTNSMTVSLVGCGNNSAIVVGAGNILNGSDYGLAANTDIFSIRGDLVDQTYWTVDEPLGVMADPAYVHGHNLTIGKKYRISDFATVRELDNGTWGFCAPEPLIVTANTRYSLSPFAVSELYPDDIIHYSLDIKEGPTYGLVGEYDGLGYGAITYREDPRHNIITRFDFRNYWSCFFETAVGSGVFTRYQPPTDVTEYRLRHIFDGENPGVTSNISNFYIGRQRNFVPFLFIGGAVKFRAFDQQDALIFLDGVQDTSIDGCAVVTVDAGCGNLTVQNSSTVIVTGTVSSLLAGAGSNVRVNGDVESTEVGAGAGIKVTGDVYGCSVMPYSYMDDFEVGDRANELIGYPIVNIKDTTYADLLTLATTGDIGSLPINYFTDQGMIIDSFVIPFQPTISVGSTVEITGSLYENGYWTIKEASYIGGGLGVYTVNEDTSTWTSDAASAVVRFITGSMTIGQKYRITDYRSRWELKSSLNVPEYYTGPIEPLVVTAISPTELAPQVINEAHPEDIVRYHLVPPPNLFVGSDRGCIYYCNDTKRDIYGYWDWRNVSTRLWEVVPGDGHFVQNYPDGTIDGQAYEDWLMLASEDTGSGIHIEDHGGSIQAVVFKVGGPNRITIGQQADVIVFEGQVRDVRLGACNGVVAYAGVADLWTKDNCSVTFKGMTNSESVNQAMILTGATFSGSLTNCIVNYGVGDLAGDRTNEFIGFPPHLNEMSIGTSGNIVSIDASGNLTLSGKATIFEDMTGSITNIRTLGAGASLVDATQSIDFTSSADQNDYAWISFQLPHGWKIGSVVYPHIHWVQTSDASPNWVIRYRWQTHNSASVSGWTDISVKTTVSSYGGGSWNQISKPASGITPPEGAGLSDILQIQIVRDNTNYYGISGGSNSYTGTVSVTSVDVHIEKDTLGSNTEFNK